MSRIARAVLAAPATLLISGCIATAPVYAPYPPPGYVPLRFGQPAGPPTPEISQAPLPPIEPAARQYFPPPSYAAPDPAPGAPTPLMDPAWQPPGQTPGFSAFRSYAPETPAPPPPIEQEAPHPAPAASLPDAPDTALMAPGPQPYAPTPEDDAKRDRMFRELQGAPPAE